MNLLLTPPLTALSECATGKHTWKTALIIGRALCVICGMEGYCLYCAAGDIPPGSPLRVCRIHRHSPARLSDSTRPLSAFSRKETQV